MSSDFSTTSIAPLLPRKVLCTNNLDSSKNHSKADTNIEQKQKQKQQQQQQQQQPQNLMDRERYQLEILKMSGQNCVYQICKHLHTILLYCLCIEIVLLLIIDSR